MTLIAELEGVAPDNGTRDGPLVRMTTVAMMAPDDATAPATPTQRLRLVTATS
jgi:hypothetical protein